MDIKSVIRQIIPTAIAAKSIRQERKAGGATDRDANGQQPDKGHEQRHPLTPEQIQEALHCLEQLPGVKDNSLTVRLQELDGIRVVYIEDRDGKVVRRIPEADLHHVLKNREKKSGHLLNKAL